MKIPSEEDVMSTSSNMQDIHRGLSRSDRFIRDLYTQLDGEINGRIGCNMGFGALIRATPSGMDTGTLDGFRSRYSVIKRFQDECLTLFNASLGGQCDPLIAAMVVGDLPQAFGTAYHQKLTDRQHRTPVFFRTDELEPGKFSEIQCCGSGWDIVELLRQLYMANPDVFDPPRHFKYSLAAGFAVALRRYLDTEPLIHHLMDNASRPHGMRYFVQRTRDEGLRYFGYDYGISPNDCNFVRSHDFVSLLHHNFYADRMERCNLRKVYFDLPPSALFDGKLIMVWPFWSVTRRYFSDDVRNLFPYTALITPDGIEMESGERITIDEFCSMPQRTRKYYLKYAGTDIGINWGSKAVFLASTMSGVQIRKRMASITEDWNRGRYWVMQSAIRRKETISAFTREGRTAATDAYAKWSGYYGPDGLMAIMVFHKRSHKVHGNADTIISIVH